MAREEHLSIVEVATVGNGVEKHAFRGKTMNLEEAVEECGFSTYHHEVRLRRDGKFTTVKDPKKATVQDGDTVFLVPPISGGTC